MLLLHKGQRLKINL